MRSRSKLSWLLALVGLLLLGGSGLGYTYWALARQPLPRKVQADLPPLGREEAWAADVPWPTAQVAMAVATPPEAGSALASLQASPTVVATLVPSEASLAARATATPIRRQGVSSSGVAAAHTLARAASALAHSTPTLVPSPLPSPTALPPTPTPEMVVGPPTRLVIPSIGLDSRVVPVGWHEEVDASGKRVSVWNVAEYAVGWHENSALPGQGGNIVFAGHNNIYGEVFRYLESVQIGDAVLVYLGERAYSYTVAERFIVREEGVSAEQRRENARWIGPFPDERVTMVACWPYTGNSHRIIVIARPTP